MSHNKITKSTLLSLEQKIKEVANRIDSVISILQQIAPDETELINKLNRMSPSNSSSCMADALRVFDTKIKRLDESGLYPRLINSL